MSDNWNDFGFYTLYNLYYINGKNEEIEIGYVKIGKKGQVDGGIDLPLIFEDVPSDVFSLGQDIEFYSQLRELGDEVRLECLIGLRDIAYDEKLYEQVLGEKVVIESLLRNHNIKTVENQFRRVAHGGAVLTKYNFKFDIQPDEKNTTLLFEVVPESLPPTNIHTIIGTNGVGKTTALKGIINGYLQGNLDEDFSNAVFISFSIFDKNGIYESNNAGKEYYYVGVKSIGAKTKSQEDLKNEFYNSISIILSKKRHFYLHRMLEILSADSILNNFGLIDILEAFFDSSKENEIVEEYSVLFSEIFDDLSSGHQIILLSVCKIVELIVEKTLILIDEPETHLHPPLLSAFIRAISEITIVENAVAILATHSPVVLQEVPKSCVSVIRKHGNRLDVRQPRFETFGENVGVLTEEVFGLEIPKTGFHTLLKSIVNETPDYNIILSRFNGELSIEAKSIIRTYINEIKRI
ncbi:AAA family ATPase [Exiguobacterium undae]|uniref:AAA family ATPase n=1 Tax=Exiguobacterium undae TaxID=169177 RepID=UPI00385107B4